jgi:C4-dicarboxylate-binding protein DctP
MRKRKIKNSSLLVIAVTISLFLMISPVQAEKTISFKFGFVSSPKLQGGQYGLLIEKYVNEYCKGKVNAKFFPSGVLGTDPEMIDKIKMGVIEGMVAPLNVFGNTVPYVDSLMLPFLTDSWEKVFAFVNSPVGQEFLDGLKGYGYKGLGFSGYGLSGLECNTKASTLAEFQKLKFRVPESPVLKKTFTSLQITPMVIQFPDLYEALKQGVVDGCDLPADVAVFVKFTEVIKYFIQTNHNFGWYMFIVNDQWFEKLPDDLKGPFREAIARASKESLENSHQAELDALKIFEEKGIQIIKPSSEEFSKMIDLTKAVYDWRISAYNDFEKEMAKKAFEQFNYQYNWTK